jgi:ankyrin repeat protein
MSCHNPKVSKPFTKKARKVPYSYNSLEEALGSYLAENEKNLHAAIYTAMKVGDLKTLQSILKIYGAKVFNEFSKKGNFQPLHLAIIFNHLPVVKFLVEKAKVDKEEKNMSGDTPLYRAVEEGKLDIIRYLIKEAHANKAFIDEFGNTLLHIAIECGHFEVATYFIKEEGADIEAMNNFKDRPLHIAVRKGQLDIVKYLVEQAGAKAAYNYGGKGCLAIAAEEGHLSVLMYLVNTKKITQELELGTDLIVSPTYPLLVAVSSKQINQQVQALMVEYLVKKVGVNPQIKDCIWGNTALHKAAEAGSLDVIGYLIEKAKLDLWPKNLDGETPLDIAIKRGHLAIFRYYLEKTPKINLPPK